MNNRFRAFILMVLAFWTASPVWSNNPAIIPQPVSLTLGQGAFTLSSKQSIGLMGNLDGQEKVAAYLASALSRSTGYTFSIRKNDPSAPIRFVLLKNKNTKIGKEGYLLSVSPDSTVISANGPAGLFYGVQTFLQLLPPEIESKKVVPSMHWSVPSVQIMDYPRFGWRGMMLDVSRHFFTKDQVKQFIDEMVRYKYNILHWHLTDDQGWRIEIKSLPNLTKTGAWHAERVGKWATFSSPSPEEPKTYGGFYSQDDIREIVQYAKDRFVSVLPEVDIPGHSLAMVASYPELSCTPGTYHVNAGEKFIDWYPGGFKALIDNTLCPANEKTYQYLDKVFTEVAQLFPMEYIHMGGDECAKNFWEKSEAVAQLMKKEKLKDMHEVQSYFVKRIEKIIQSKGKKMIGWDEILEGGLAPNATVMSWRGMKGGIEAAKLGHPVIMTPSNHCYIDLYQGDPIVEPPTYSMVRLKQSYSFEPVPEGVNANLILGGQANLWTEQVTNTRSAQYMAWPRSFAISESLWTPKENKGWENFTHRAEQHFARFDHAEINYSRSMFDAIFVPKKTADGQLSIELTNELDGINIHYSFDETLPDSFYPLYTQPLSVPKDAVHLKVVTYRRGVRVGRLMAMPITELNRRAGIK